MTLIEFKNPGPYTLVILAGVLSLTACRREQQNNTAASSTPMTSDSPLATVAQISRPPRTGPRLVVDSAATEPNIEMTDGEYVLHLPTTFARVLEDSFPKFVPVSRQKYDSSLVASIDLHNPQLAPLSTVVGDFNGDHKADVAMLGYALNAAFAFVILVSGEQPTAVVVDRLEARGSGKEYDYIRLAKPQIYTGYGEKGKTTIDLATDAVKKEIVDKLTMLVYLDHGVAKQLQLSELD